MNHTLVIHIGMPKTGSTALQYFLYLNRDKLERHGWCYPLLAEELSDVNGASSGVTNGNFFYEDDHYGYHSDFDMDSDGWNKKWACVQKHLENKNVILSSEAFFRYGTEKLLTYAMQRFHNVKVIVYLRRQDKVVESFYNNRIKDGVYDGTFHDYLDLYSVKEVCQYLSKLDSISRITGKENLIVRVYEKQQFYGKKHSIEDDFLSVLHFDKEIDRWADCGTQNPSLYGNYNEIRKIFNSLHGIAPALDREIEDWEYNDLFMQVSNFFHKDKEERGYFKTEERIAFLEQFASDNKQIAKEYLNREDGILFYDDRMDYPLHENSQYDSFERDMIRIFSAMICIQNQKMRICMQNYETMKEKYNQLVKKMAGVIIVQKSVGRKLLLFGAGNRCRALLHYFSDLAFDLIVDNNSAKDGMIFENKMQVINVHKVENWTKYFVIVTCAETDEIEKQLAGFGLMKEKDYILMHDYGV